MNDINLFLVPIKLNNGSVVQVEARSLGGPQKVSAFSEALPVQTLTDAIENIAGTIAESLQKIKPRKATVEFGLEVGVEAGKLVTLLCGGSSKANLKISLEFSSPGS